MITYFKRTVHGRKIKKIKYFVPGCWINVINPSEKEVNYLIDKFGLDKQNLLSGLDPNEIPRLDFVDNDIYIFVKIILPTEELHTYLILINDKFILTLSRFEPGFFQSIMNNKIEIITTQKLKCLIKLFYVINKEFENTTINIVKIVRLKRAKTKRLKEKDVDALLAQEERLNNLLLSYYHMNLLYERIIKKMKFFEEDREIIEDLIVEASQGFNLCKSSLNTISNIRNYYMILLSNRLNRIITILTIFTILLSIIAAVSGIYGMNISLPLQENSFVFYYILFSIGMVWMFFIFYLRRKEII